MKRRTRPVGCFLFVILFFFFGFVNESMPAKPQVDGGYYHTLWVKSDGTLWAWGYNYFGQLGDDTTIDKHSPVQIGSDGDGKTDIAVYRPSNGWWIVMPSSNPSAPYAVAWGAPTDIPVPGDYDGDGKADIAVWRPGEGYWYIIRSSDGGITRTQWGWGLDPINDEPISQ